MMDVTVVRGPIVQSYSGIVYSVTLLSGHVVTNPDGFGTGMATERLSGTPDAGYEHPPTKDALGSGQKEPRKQEVVLTA